jgi:hypothetical protein
VESELHSVATREFRPNDSNCKGLTLIWTGIEPLPCSDAKPEARTEIVMSSSVSLKSTTTSNSELPSSELIAPPFRTASQEACAFQSPLAP